MLRISRALDSPLTATQRMKHILQASSQNRHQSELSSLAPKGGSTECDLCNIVEILSCTLVRHSEQPRRRPVHLHPYLYISHVHGFMLPKVPFSFVSKFFPLSRNHEHLEWLSLYICISVAPVWALLRYTLRFIPTGKASLSTVKCKNIFGNIRTSLASSSIQPL